MAFIETKNFKPINNNNQAVDENITAELEAQGKKMITVRITNAFQQIEKTVIMEKTW